MLHGRDESEEIKDKLRRYYDAVHAEHRRQGYLHLEPDHCPALEAQNLHTQAENALIDSAHDLFGIDSHQLYGDNRKKYLDLLMGGCIKALAEIQKECGRDTKHATTEPSPIDPTPSPLRQLLHRPKQKGSLMSQPVTTTQIRENVISEAISVQPEHALFLFVYEYKGTISEKQFGPP